MEECIFCKIVKKEIPAKIAHENEHLIAFHDIRPQAPIHVLIIPKKHIPTINDIGKKDLSLTAEMVELAQTLAKENNIADDGYRLVFNCNKKGGQEVYHIHLHLLAGRQFYWPPG